MSIFIDNKSRMKTSPKNLDELRERFNRGEPFEFLNFWGHQSGANGAITQSCLSQWYEAAFESEGSIYPTAEHFMMAAKARLFNDEKALDNILKSKSPGAAKAHGREIAGFDEEVWTLGRVDVVIRANRLKFSQHAALGEFLLRTGTKILVEASPVDRIWGIGLSASDTDAGNPNHWKGLNLLGFALMAVREELEQPTGP